MFSIGDILLSPLRLTLYALKKTRLIGIARGMNVFYEDPNSKEAEESKTSPSDSGEGQKDDQ